MKLFRLLRAKLQSLKNKNHESGKDTALGVEKGEEIKSSIQEKQIEYLFDLNSLKKEVAQTVEYMGHKATNINRWDEVYMLYAWQCKEGKTHCVFAEVESEMERFRIHVPYFQDDSIHLMLHNTFTFEEFYNLNQEEFFGKAYNIRKDTSVGQYEREKIWEALMKAFPEYACKKTVRTAIFEKYFPYSLDRFVGAEDYSGKGMLYKMLKPVSQNQNGMVEFQCWEVCDYGKETEKVRLTNSFCTKPYPETEEDFVSRVYGMFEHNLDDAMMAIPHRRILVDDTRSKSCGSMLFAADYRELHIYQSKTDTSCIILRIYSVYNGRPQEGGRMEGYTFKRTLDIPSEQYQWSDEKLIAEYQQSFRSCENGI